jgi:predicted HTH transcriptional regulator
LANTRTGGTIVFGVEDQTKHAVGVRDANATIDAVLRAVRLVKPAVSLASNTPAVVPFDDVVLVVVQILPNNGALYQSGSGFWVRRGTHTIPMAIDEISAHLYSAGTLLWENTLCPRATLADIDPQRVEAYLALRANQRRVNLQDSSLEELLLGMQCVALDPIAGTIRPTNAGMLLFGYDPTSSFRTAK